MNFKHKMCEHSFGRQSISASEKKDDKQNTIQAESVFMHSFAIILFNILGVIWTSVYFSSSNLFKFSHNSSRQ